MKPCAIVARLRKSASILLRLRSGITPGTNAVSTIIFVFSQVAIVLWYRSRVRVDGNAEVVTELV
jgi:ABC-type spermidine/putrescine transport system permease subunit II